MSDGDRGKWRNAMGVIDLHGRKAEDIIRDLRDGWPDVFETRKCETCKFWGSSDEGVFRQCRKMTTGKDGLPEQGALAFGYSFACPEEAVVVVTRADFGCVMWEGPVDNG